jgi:predicted dehydrogenase
MSNDSKSRNLTRRQFLGKALRAAGAVGAGAALPQFIPSRALGADGVAPSEQVALGFIGVGGMGTGHLSGLRRDPRVRVLAVADVYELHRSRAQAMVGNDCAAYNDYRELLDRPDIEAVLIATPDHWHALTTIHACQAGKDIYCEKPLSLTIEDGRAMVDAVRRYGRVFQTGSQQRSEDNFRFACELVRSGRIGRLHTVRVGIGGAPTSGWEPDTAPPPGLDWNMWLGPAPWAPFNPQRCIYNFRWFWDYSGGKMTDWGAHHNDIAQWGMGTDRTGPIRIQATKATFPADGLYDTATSFEVVYEYANGVTLITSSDGHGVRFEGPDGWVHVDRGFLEASPPELLHEKLGPGDVHLYRSPGHHEDWLNCIQTRQRPICDVEIGYKSAVVCHLGNIAIRTGRALQWDPDRERFVNDDEANRWISRPYRAPWHL